MSRALLNLATGSSTSPDRAFGELVPWLLLLIGVVVVGAVIIWLARRAVDRASDSGGGFSLHELRQLHASGQLSDEEYERAKASIIGHVSAPAESDPDEGPEDGEARPAAGDNASS